MRTQCIDAWHSWPHIPLDKCTAPAPTSAFSILCEAFPNCVLGLTNRKQLRNTSNTFGTRTHIHLTMMRHREISLITDMKSKFGSNANSGSNKEGASAIKKQLITEGRMGGIGGAIARYDGESILTYSSRPCEHNASRHDIPVHTFHWTKVQHRHFNVFGTLCESFLICVGPGKQKATAQQEQHIRRPHSFCYDEA